MHTDLYVKYNVNVSLCVYSGGVSEDSVSFCERMLELFTDLEAQLPTRRFFNTFLDNTHFIVSCSKEC